MPESEQHLRKKLGDATLEFVVQIMQMAAADMETREPDPDRVIEFDEPKRRQVTEIYRQAVEEAAAQGIETALAWQTLAVWTDDGRQRIGYFARALDCVESGRDNQFMPRTAATEWTDTLMRADCLFEIGQVHAHDGDPSVAREFLLRALSLAQEAERLRLPAGITSEDGLEGRIAELLLQLPADEDESQRQ